MRLYGRQTIMGYSELRNNMKFGRRKASQLPPSWFQKWLEEIKKILINNIQETEFVIVWIDEGSFNSSELPLYYRIKVSITYLACN